MKINKTKPSFFSWWWNHTLHVPKLLIPLIWAMTAVLFYGMNLEGSVDDDSRLFWFLAGSVAVAASVGIAVHPYYTYKTLPHAYFNNLEHKNQSWQED
jgi:hypothetical protein